MRTCENERAKVTYCNILLVSYMKIKNFIDELIKVTHSSGKVDRYSKTVLGIFPTTYFEFINCNSLQFM